MNSQWVTIRFAAENMIKPDSPKEIEQVTGCVGISSIRILALEAVNLLMIKRGGFLVTQCSIMKLIKIMLFRTFGVEDKVQELLTKLQSIFKECEDFP